MFEIRRVNKYVYDLFFYTGWNDWARVKQGRSSTFVVDGGKVSHTLLKKLDEVLNPDFPTPIGNRYNLV